MSVATAKTAAGPVKTFVVDTNVLLHSPNAIFAFGEHHLVIPITVLEELDKFKSANNELGQNARTVSDYTVAVDGAEGYAACGCRGFEFKATCRHVAASRVLLGRGFYTEVD